MVLIICTKNELNLTNRYWDMVPDRQKVRTDGQTEWTDDAKTISLRLRRGIKKLYNPGALSHLVMLSIKASIGFLLFVLMLYIPVNNLSVILGHFLVFLGWTSTKQCIKWFAQRTKHIVSSESRTSNPSIPSLTTLYRVSALFIMICIVNTLVVLEDTYIWDVTWDYQQWGMCNQQRLRPACAYAQSDQSLCLSLEYSMTVKNIIWSF